MPFMSKFNYKTIRSARKSLSVEINQELEIIVRAPMRVKNERIEEFISQHESWIEKHLEIQKNRQKNRLPEPNDEEIKTLKADAKRILPRKVALYAAIMGVEPKSVRITSAKKRLGSCSGDNRLNFSYRLLMYDDDVIDYVVIHELAHIREHNHSKRFYEVVKEFCPDYKRIEKKFKG